MATAQAPATFQTTCKITTLLNTTPCLDCLSETELEALLLYIWAYLYSDQNDLPGVLADAVDSPMSKKQALIAEIQVMAQNILSGTTVAEIAANMKCVPCADPALVRAAILKYKCVYWNAIVQNPT